MRAATPGMPTAPAAGPYGEDFEPLRIRPYVHLAAPVGAAADAPPPDAVPPEALSADALSAEQFGDPASTMPLFLPQGHDPGAGPGGPGGPGVPPGPLPPERTPPPEADPLNGPPTRPHAVPLTDPHADPHAALPPYDEHPDATSGFAPDAAPDVTPDVAPGPRRSRRRAPDPRHAGRRPSIVVLGVAAAVVAVIGTAAFAGGLFGGDEADRVMPDPSAPAWPSDQPEPPSTEASGSTLASPSATPSPSASSTPPAPRPSDGTGGSATDTGSTPTRAETRTKAPTAGTSLSRGDRGQGVTDLQHRLRELGLYDGPMHGRYDKNVEKAVAAYQARRGITADPRGVYGSTTRGSLEGETAGR
ncbi:peptidoglycan-binding protein [Streptomyces sp. NPDC047928]|uniref:peptidoglycan-binding domain-containing protein n=1 Tax=unclassified Streptomyces TaxID=2593676 RepID=UPI003724294A